MNKMLRTLASKLFGRVSAPLSEAEQFLQSEGIAYTKRQDGMIEVDEDIYLNGRGLTHLPNLSTVIVNYSFWCHSNQLTSLAGTPASVGGLFFCNDNPQLTSLEYATQKFQRLVSDFGTFDTWNDVPEALKISPETKQKQREDLEEQQRKKEKRDAWLDAGMPLRKPLVIGKPLQLKK